MEISYVPGRFPATSLRSFGVRRRCCIHLPLNFNNEPSATTTATNLKYDVAGVKSESAQNRMFILGIGYVGKFFAQELRNKGWVVSGTCTSNAKKKQLEKLGLTAYDFDANEPELEVLDILNHHTHLLVSIPPVAGIGDLMLQHDKLLKSRLRNGNLRWLCYLSSTGVYGNCGGAWVNEDYPVNGTKESARARLAAEEGWLKFGRQLGLDTKIFRLGGIYGPGRSAIDTILKRQPLSEGQRMRSSSRYTSRVHVSDICQALYSSIQKQTAGSIYNIVDDDPAPREEVFLYAQNLIEKQRCGQGIQLGSPDGAESSHPMASLRGDKRVLNARMKEELRVELLHPSYRQDTRSGNDFQATSSPCFCPRVFLQCNVGDDMDISGNLLDQDIRHEQLDCMISVYEENQHPTRMTNYRENKRKFHEIFAREASPTCRDEIREATNKILLAIDKNKRNDERCVLRNEVTDKKKPLRKEKKR